MVIFGVEMLANSITLRIAKYSCKRLVKIYQNRLLNHPALELQKGRNFLSVNLFKQFGVKVYSNRLTDLRVLMRSEGLNVATTVFQNCVVPQGSMDSSGVITGHRSLGHIKEAGHFFEFPFHGKWGFKPCPLKQRHVLKKNDL